MHLIAIIENAVIKHRRQKIKSTQYLTWKSSHCILKNCPLFKKKKPNLNQKHSI